MLGLPEVDKSWWVPEAILFGHESVVHLDHLDAILCCLVVNLLQGPQHLRALIILLIDWTVMWGLNLIIKCTHMYDFEWQVLKKFHNLSFNENATNKSISNLSVYCMKSSGQNFV